MRYFKGLFIAVMLLSWGCVEYHPYDTNIYAQTELHTVEYSHYALARYRAIYLWRVYECHLRLGVLE